MTKHGIKYQRPKVTLLNNIGLGVAELASRTAYDSFKSSENKAIKEHKNLDVEELNKIDSSKLVENLIYVHHHNSIAEHMVLQYLIEGTSRSTLIEYERHRLQSMTVRSTRYTMSTLLKIFVASLYSNNPNFYFNNKIKDLDMFILSDTNLLELEYDNLFLRLQTHYNMLTPVKFMETVLTKGNLKVLEDNRHPDIILEALLKGKNKRNVGDAFKWIVNDNWKVDLVITINVRSLSNFMKLRDSDAAYFQIKWLAEEILNATPKEYRKLLGKKYK